MKYLTFSLTFFLLIINTATLQAAEIKKWTDEKGHVYYGDTPPLSVKAQTIKTNKRPSHIGNPLPRLSNTKTQASNTPATTAPASTLEPEQAKEACENAKKDLAVINKSSRIQLRSADGSLRYMTKDEIKTRRERSMSDIEKFCS